MGMPLLLAVTVVVAFVLLPVHSQQDYILDDTSSTDLIQFTPNGTQIGLDAKRCSGSDIWIGNAQSGYEWNGMPRFSVQILNQCRTGCDISNIHVYCGQFSSATIINPKVFKRLEINDCLVNDGKPLKYGTLLSFKYHTSFKYPLSVASFTC
ncbi:protein TAPETUM DETERMINANT 1-like [Argentina anserina]|uniref:protein TAPETUM DETERMINANT 1-like n=1 Tax=Argentina anserina TaxID=57926 RepID=UPI00217685CC|nr:protein TAPETUM DETERMINANT 1-like [Potentilla anserina]